jgi:putative hydrolase of the HAD superfamily
MGISIPGRVVVFDYGEVISVSPNDVDRAQIENLAGVQRDGTGGTRTAEFWAAYWKYRDGLDEGTTSIRDYWQRISDELGQNWTEARIHSLWLADFRSWLSVDEQTLDVIIELKRGGTRLALLSNAGRDFGSYFRHGTLSDLFEAFFVSGELGQIKPGADIFHTALSELGITAEQMVFIDNKEINVEGARALGITGHTFTGAGELRAFLTQLAK